MFHSRVYKAEGIILKRRNVGEADRIVTVFTKEYGKLKVIAKGIRRITSRRAPHLEVFGHVQLMLHRGKALDVVTEVELKGAQNHIRSDLALVNGAYHLCELVDRLTPERQESRDVYVLLLDALENLNMGHFNSMYEFSEQFALTLLHVLGFLPSNRVLRSEQIQPFIESIVERKIKTYQFLTKS